jgi:hypothetical protein
MIGQIKMQHRFSLVAWDGITNFEIIHDIAMVNFHAYLFHTRIFFSLNSQAHRQHFRCHKKKYNMQDEKEK